LAEAYNAILNNPNPTLFIIISVLSNYIPFIRKISIDVNKKFKNACAVIRRVSKKLMEEKYNEAKNGELKSKDLLSLLININKTLPIEEKLIDEELQYQVIKININNISVKWLIYLCIILFIIVIAFIRL
jgi:hypothetical protein